MNVKGRIDPSVHGRHGKLSVTTSPPNVTHPFSSLLLQATQELSDEFPFKLDVNDGTPIGIVDNQAEGSSPATAYLDSTGDNVHILINSHVTRVISLPTDRNFFRIVEFADAGQPQGTRRQIEVRKEVVISGGGIGSPQILMNSGIGKGEELEAVGIKVLVNNLSIGKNFSDQPMVYTMFDMELPPTDYDRDVALAEWEKTRTGPLAHSSHLNHITFVRLSKDIKLSFPDPTGREHTPHAEFALVQISHVLPKMAVPIPLPPQDSINVTLQVSTINLHPVSRILSGEADIAIFREAVRSAKRLYSAPVFNGSVNDIVFPPANITADDELDTFIWSQASAYLHGVGSLSMSPHDAGWGAVDPDFRVKRVKGLRVVDASVIPSTPSAPHTQAAVHGFAERASLMILESWE